MGIVKEIALVVSVALLAVIAIAFVTGKAAGGKYRLPNGEHVTCGLVYSDYCGLTMLVCADGTERRCVTNAVKVQQ